jgi:hypothetical protein
MALFQNIRKMSRQPVIGFKKNGQIKYIRLTQTRYNLPYYKRITVEELMSNLNALSAYLNTLHAYSGWEPATEEEYRAYNGTEEAPPPALNDKPADLTLEEARETWSALTGRRPGNRSLATLLNDIEKLQN